MNIDIKTDGEQGTKRLQQKFTTLAGNVKNLRGLMKRIGIDLLNEVSLNFDNEGNEGNQWTPLKAATIARRRNKIKETIGILHDSGDLRRSFVPDSDDTTVRVGSPVTYSIFHEEGSDKIPKRKMLPTQRRGLEIAIDVTERYVDEKIREAALRGTE